MGNFFSTPCVYCGRVHPQKSPFCNMYDAVLNNDLKSVIAYLSHSNRSMFLEERRAEDTPLKMAAKGGFPDIVWVLLQAGANTNCIGEFAAIHYACTGNHWQVVRLLLDRGVDVNLKSKTSKAAGLHFAAYSGHVDVARILLDRGANVVLKNKDGNTPLHIASAFNHVYIVRFLLERGVDCNIRGQNMFTPLHSAAEFCATEVARLLLEQGADATAMDKEKDTPLHWAARKNHVAMTAILLDHGVDIDFRGCRRRTPLHRASEFGAIDVVQLLLIRGADATVKDYAMFPMRGKTALDLAKSNGHATIVRILSEAQTRGAGPSQESQCQSEGTQFEKPTSPRALPAEGNTGASRTDNDRIQSDANEGESSSASWQCPICFEPASDRSVMVPCGHLLCSTCVPLCTECPMCRVAVTQHMRIFE